MSCLENSMERNILKTSEKVFHDIHIKTQFTNVHDDLWLKKNATFSPQIAPSLNVKNVKTFYIDKYNSIWKIYKNILQPSLTI